MTPKVQQFVDEIALKCPGTVTCDDQDEGYLRLYGIPDEYIPAAKAIGEKYSFNWDGWDEDGCACWEIIGQ